MVGLLGIFVNAAKCKKFLSAAKKERKFVVPKHTVGLGREPGRQGNSDVFVVFSGAASMPVGSSDPKFRDSWETLSSEEIWNLEQEEELGKLYQNLSRQFAIQDVEEAWEAQWEPEWKTDYNYPE